MTDNNTLKDSPLLAEILRELREIRQRQDEIMKAQEDAGRKREGIFRFVTGIQSAKQKAHYRPRIDYGAIADFRARGSRLRP